MLRVPPSLQAPIRELLSSSEEALGTLLRDLAGARPTASVDAFVDGLPAVETGHSRATLSSIVHLLFSLHSLREASQDPAAIASDVVNAVKVIESDAVSTAEPEQFGRLEEFLATALAKDSPVALSAKAVRLLSQYDAVYASAQIASDARLVFSGDDSLTPSNAVIVHNLQVQFFSEDDLRSKCFALDIRDLNQLRDVIDRAIEKESRIAQKLEVIVGVLSVGRDEP